MRWYEFHALAFLGLLVAVAAAEEPPAQLRGRAAITFQATSTLHNFSGSGEAKEFLLQPAGDQTWSADVELPVSSLDTGNGWRDDDMREMFHSDTCPTIHAHFKLIEAQTARRDTQLRFDLTICKVTQPVIAKLSGWQQSADSLSFDAEFDVSLASFQLDAPRTLFVSVSDTVHVSVKANLRRD